jgi:ketopantoate reductase
MSITVYGAGAVGGLIGASMARGEEDVLLVDKVSAHVDAINARGLRISGCSRRRSPTRPSRTSSATSATSPC